MRSAVVWFGACYMHRSFAQYAAAGRADPAYTIEEKPSRAPMPRIRGSRLSATAPGRSRRSAKLAESVVGIAQSRVTLMGHLQYLVATGQYSRAVGIRRRGNEHPEPRAQFAAKPLSRHAGAGDAPNTIGRAHQRRHPGALHAGIGLDQRRRDGRRRLRPVQPPRSCEPPQHPVAVPHLR